MEEIGESVSMPVQEDRSEMGGAIETKEVVEAESAGEKPVVGGETRNEASAEWGLETPANGDAPMARKVITCYLIKVPRPIEVVEIKNQISNKFQEMNAIDSTLNEVAQERKDVLAGLEEPRTLLKTLREEFKGKTSENKSFREEMSSLKDDFDLCRSEEELDAKIAMLEEDLQHNTYSLKEEKLIVKKIQTLKASRSKVINNSNVRQKRDSIKETSILPLDEQIKELKARIAKIVKENEDEEKKASALTAQVKILLDKKSSIKAEIDDLRAELPSINIDDHMKYIKLSQEAKVLAQAKDTETVQALCAQQVEELMRIWNTDFSFRSEYIKNNSLSTVRRLGTPDGRSHVPDDSTGKSGEEKVERPKEELPKPRKEEKDDKPQKKENLKVSTPEGKATASKKLKQSELPKLDGKFSDAEVDLKEVREHLEENVEFEVDEAQLELERQKRREEEIEKAKAAEARKKKKEEKKKVQREAKLEKERLKKQAEKEKKQRKKAQAVSVERDESASTSNDSENGGEATALATENGDTLEADPVESVVQHRVQHRGKKAPSHKVKPAVKTFRRKKRSPQQQLVDAFYSHWQMVLVAVLLLLAGSMTVAYLFYM